MAEGDDVKLEICNYEKPMKLLHDLYISKPDADITIKLSQSDDQASIKAHVEIIRLSSSFFRKELKKERANPNELSIDSTGIRSHKIMMFYLYTGKMTLNPENIAYDLNCLGLLKLYQAEELDRLLADKISEFLDMENVFKIIPVLEKFDCPLLKEECFNFLDLRGEKIAPTKGFYRLDKSMVATILKRDSFILSELEIFKLVCEWRKRNKNKDEKGSLLSCVRFGWMTPKELLVNVSKEENVLTTEELFRRLYESVGDVENPDPRRSPRDVNVNMATVKPCKVIVGDFIQLFDKEKSYSCDVGAPRGLTFELFQPCVLNHIRFILTTGRSRFVNYEIHTSLDGLNFEDLVNYDHYNCRGEQLVYFEAVKVRFISIVISHSQDLQEVIKIKSFGCYYKTKENLPSVYKNIIAPSSNVALREKGAVVVDGNNGRYIINGDYLNYDDKTGYTYHNFIRGQSIIIQLPQPYFISYIKMLLWAKDDRHYNYFIRTSMNGTDWEFATKRIKESTRCTGWQTVTFNSRVTVYIHIQGIYCSVGKEFRVVYLECHA